MTKEAHSKWASVIVSSVHCPVGHFPMEDCDSQQELQAALSSFRDCGINGYFGVVLPAAAPCS